MLSDSCFQLIDDLLEAIANYDYSDDFKAQLILIISGLNDVRDDLDHCGGVDYEIVLLKNDKKRSIQIASKMYANAQKRREMSSVDFYDFVYDKEEDSSK